MSKIILEDQTTPSSPATSSIAIYSSGGVLRTINPDGTGSYLGGHTAGAWGLFDTNGNITHSFNIASITDVGAGQVQANYTQHFTTTGSCPIQSFIKDPSGSSTNTLTAHVQLTNYTVSSVQLWVGRVATFQGTDPNYHTVAVYGKWDI